MKRLFFTASLAVCLLSLSAFGTETSIPSVLKSFYHTFQNAQNVNWTQVDNMLRIGFVSDGHQQFAYYLDDELVVVAKEITTEELPAAMKNQLGKYKDGVVSQVYELEKNRVKEYCATLDSPSKHIILKGSNRLKVFSEESK